MASQGNAPDRTGLEASAPSAPGIAALATFVGALALAASLIAFDVFQPWSASGVVVVYGCLLYTFRRFLPLTTESKDSAYFLGFSLNLVFLFVAFRAYGETATTTVEAVNYLIQAIGSAISATITGLVVRYALYLADDQELIQRKIFDELQEEMKKSATGFRQNQRSLTQGITSFLATHRKVLEQEEQAAEAYVGQLRTSLISLQELHRSHVEVMTQTVRDLEPASQAALKQIASLNDKLADVGHAQVIDRLTSVCSDFTRALDAARTATHEVRGQFLELTKEVGATSTQLVGMVAAAPDISNDLRAVDAILTDFISTIQTRVDQFSAG